MKTFCGKTHEQMNDILTFMCELEDKQDFSYDEDKKFDIAIQCIVTVMNRMIDNRPIEFDEE